MIKIGEYQYEDGTSPFRTWFDALESRAAAKVTVAQTKIALGQFGNLKPCGEGVFEFKIDYGPGYRVYLAHDGIEHVILLGGGDKTTQGRDIEEAKRLWAEYKKRKARAKKASDERAAESARRKKARNKKG
jgi:putative addiction module killer protein